MAIQRLFKGYFKALQRLLRIREHGKNNYYHRQSDARALLYLWHLDPTRGWTLTGRLLKGECTTRSLKATCTWVTYLSISLFFQGWLHISAYPSSWLPQILPVLLLIPCLLSLLSMCLNTICNLSSSVVARASSPQQPDLFAILIKFCSNGYPIPALSKTLDRLLLHAQVPTCQIYVYLSLTLCPLLCAVAVTTYSPSDPGNNNNNDDGGLTRWAATQLHLVRPSD